jgi:hypothetical protein
MEIEAPPSSPKAQAVEKEYADIMSNPQNPRHAGLHQGDPAVSAYIDNLYKRAYPNSAPIQLGEPERVAVEPLAPQPGETPDAAETRLQNEVILSPLRQEWGPNFDTRVEAAKAVMGELFAGRGEVLDDLGRLVRMTYGPKGEAAVLQLFAELGDLKNQKGGY